MMSITDFDKGWMLGFIEGEGSFTYCSVKRSNNNELVKVPCFTINQIYREPLEYLKSYFNGGKMYIRNYKGKKYWSENKSTRYDYQIRDINTLEKIKIFCEGRLKHPGKIKDFENWKLLFNNFIGEEEHRKNSRIEMNERWKKQSWREKRSTETKKIWNNPEYREKALVGLNRIRNSRWTPEMRKKQSERMKDFLSDKKNLERVVANRWTPIARKKQSERMQKQRRVKKNLGENP